MRPLFAHAASLMPQAPLGQLGWLRGAVGGAIGIGLAAVVTAMLLGPYDPALPMIVALMGASAVLVFAVPASPLAQPWPVIGGNLVAAMVGIGTGLAIGSPAVAAALAVGLAIAAMSVARCLHPPGGASALLCALGASGPEQWDWFYLLPFAANVLLLAVAAWLYNNLTGHSWPHQLVVPPPPVTDSIGDTVTHADVEAVMEDWDEVLDIDADDLLALIQAAERHRKRSFPNS
nr:HPP family protein [Altererythrobacter sp. KTW20L]